MLLDERPGTGSDPTPIHLSCDLLTNVVLCAELRREAESKKAPAEGLVGEP